MLSKFSLLFLTLFIACDYLHLANNAKKQSAPYRTVSSSNPFKKISDIPLPSGYKRIHVTAGSFEEWLRKIELKKDKTVYQYDGKPKQYQFAQYAVLNIPVGKENLQQCADAIMRLRAEYLYARNQFDGILFKDNNNTPYKFHPPYNRQNFEKYLKRVFGMCGSASLSRQLRTPVELVSVNPGDVIIRGGFPGHAVIVIDVAINKKGKKIYLLAQSYMPAQDIHVLINPVNSRISPWYEADDRTMIKTPEYTFSRHEIKRW